jgi:ABC-type uncharacterized transport system substrate-binding protein
MKRILPIWGAVVMVFLAIGCEKKPSAAETGASDGYTSNREANLAGRKVLLVQSYHKGYPWVDAITRGVRMAMSHKQVDLQLYYMDTKRNTTPAWKKESGEKAKALVAEWQPDVVIAADDNAQEYFAKDFAGKARPQFVFCGVNVDLSQYGYPASNITGILERPHFNASLNLLKQMKPNTHRIALLSDYSPTSEGALAYIRKQKTPYKIVSCQTPVLFRDWKSAVENARHNADAIAVYMYHTVQSRNGALSMDPKEVMAWTVAHSKIPIVGFFIFAVDDGALCGFMESGVEHGYRAGQMALEMLQGKTAEQIPVVTALEGQSMLNLNTARQLKIPVSPDLIKQVDVVIGK